MSSPSRRRDTDIMKLMMSKYEVQLGDKKDFYVKFYGPKESPYEAGIWKIHVTLPAEYPFKSPSIGFCNKIYHPNVDEASGTVCLDVINQTWSPMFDLLNIFGVFLPQLLLYPNPSDPLNGEAASLLLSNPKVYGEKVRDHVKRYASQDIELDDDEEDDDDEDDEPPARRDAKSKRTPSESSVSSESSISSVSSIKSDQSNSSQSKDEADDSLDFDFGDFNLELEEPLSEMDDDFLLDSNDSNGGSSDSNGSSSSDRNGKEQGRDHDNDVVMMEF